MHHEFVGSNKAQSHFPRIRKLTGISYDKMLFFDDWYVSIYSLDYDCNVRRDFDPPNNTCPILPLMLSVIGVTIVVWSHKRARRMERA